MTYLHTMSKAQLARLYRRIWGRIDCGGHFGWD
jgi:hypothetical protein